MRLAVWNIQPCAELFGQSASHHGHDIRFASPEECKVLLSRGDVDVAMIGMNDVLRSVEAYAILPELVLASKSSRSFSSLRLGGPLTEVKVVDVHPEHRQAGEVAEILLREQYQLDVTMRYRETAGTNGDSPDAWVEFGTNLTPSQSQAWTDGAPQAQVLDARFRQEDREAENSGSHALDLGQEWFEMAGRPLIWGVFAIRGDRDAADLGDQLLSLADIQRLSTDGIRLRYDADVLSGLDELAHYLFYFGKVDDIPMPRFSKSPDSVHPPQ